MKNFTLLEIGENSATLIRYLESNGAPQCHPGANPAEWMLSVVGAAPGSQTTLDWPKLWRESPEYQSVKTKLHEFRTLKASTGSKLQLQSPSLSTGGAYAASFMQQWWFVQRRVAAQYWRTPSYIYSKTALTVASVSTPAEGKPQGVLLWLMFNFGRPSSSVSASTMPQIPSKDFRTRCMP